MRAELEQVTFHRVAGPADAPGERQVWDFWAPSGSHAFAQAQVWITEAKSVIRVHDRAKELSDEDLVALGRKLLTWSVGCTADTVEMVLVTRRAEHQLVRVGGEYV